MTTLRGRTSALASSLALAFMASACDSSDTGSDAPVGTLQATGGDFGDGTRFVVARAGLDVDGWVAIWHERSDSHTLAGKTFITAGTYDDVEVALDPPIGSAASGGSLQIRISLHADAPADGAFTAVDTRLDGDDPVVTNGDGEPVLGILQMTAPPEEPNTLVIDDQTITQNPPQITVAATLERAPAQLVITNAAGDVVATERIWDKHPRSYLVSIDATHGWDPVALTGALYADDGGAADLDAPILTLAGQPVTTAFTVTYPPDNTLAVGDQTLASWGYKIKVDEIDIDELPAWVAVYEDDDGQPGARLGALAVTTSPKVSVQVDLVRFVAPVEKLWVALHADLAPVGELTAADPYLRGPDGEPLTVAITATNESCDGLKTKYCDEATPNVIRWLDRCDAESDATIDCGDDAVCDDSGAYVKCTPVPDPCAGIAGTVCVDADPYATYFEDNCGVPIRVASRCGATSICDDADGSASCKLAPSCDGNATKVCDASDLTKVFWLDHCGQPNGNFMSCGATSACDDSSGTAECTLVTGCGGNATLACNAADPENLYWKNTCGEFTGSTLPCGAGLECDDSHGDVGCVNPNPCTGTAQKFCDPADLSVIKWLGGCGEVLASTIPCGANAACAEVDGEPRCVSTDVCGGNTSTVCVEDDPGNVYWVDACGALTGSTYPCGVATCDDSGAEAKCTVLSTCADTKLRVCDTNDPTTILLTNACGDDLGVFATCSNGKRCDESAPGAGDATCACVPTDEVTCFGKHFLYEPSGIKKVDSCGYPSGPVVETCANGEICHDPVGEAGPVCTTSLSDVDSPMYHRGCSFIDYVVYKTDLEVDCRCRRHAATLNDVDVYDTGGNQACVPQSDSWADGWTMGEGPHLRHMTHSFNGGGVYSPTHGEIFATKHFTDATYEGAGMVVGYDIRTGARRIVSGRFPEPTTGYTMYGSGFESVRAVGELRHEATTLPGAWDLEQGADGQLYVWGNRGGNQEITRVDPDTGLRTLVWRQVMEGEATAPAGFGQCYSTRPKATFPGGFIPVQLEQHAFAMGADGSFYLAFRNAAAEGNGVVKINSSGSTCTVVTRWNSTMGQVGGGATPQYSTVEGLGIHAGKLYATLEVGKHLLAVDLANGSRSLVANPAGSVESTPGQSTMFWDATRNLLITGGAIQSYSAVAIELTTGRRQALFLTSPGALIPSITPWETGAHGAIDNGNYQGYGALVMDPDNNDHIFLVIKWGLLKYEISTGNSYVMSQ